MSMTPAGGIFRQDIYAAALSELEQLQREMAYEQVAAGKGRMRKRLCQSTLLASGVLLSSLMSAMTVEAILHDKEHVLSSREVTAIHNLIGYVALRQNTSERWIIRALCTHFEVNDIGALASDDYDAALSYLLQLAQD